MESITTRINKARKELRKLHEKYQKELYDITLKIDKYLEGLEEEGEGGSD